MSSGGMALGSYPQHEDDSSLPERSNTIKDSFEEISEDESDYEGSKKLLLSKQLRGYSVKISIITIATIILCAELLSLALFPQPTQHHHEHRHQHESSSLPATVAPAHSSQWTDCGNTTESAIDRGCVFDTLTISWETQDCYNAETVNSFMQLKEWQPFTDVNATSTVSWDEVGQAKRRYHVNWDFHFTHCVYTWKLLQMAVLKRMATEDNLLAIEHTRHCTSLLLDRRWSWDNKDTLIHVKWPKCYLHGEWRDANFVDPFDVTAL